MKKIKNYFLDKDIFKSYKKILVLFTVFVTILMFTEAYAEINDNQWSIFAYGGKWTNNRFIDIISLKTEFERSYVWVLGVSRTINQINEHLSMEGEFNIAKHSRKQSHFEFNSAFNLRWHTFPWDNFMNTSFAYGIGPSFATKKPNIEERAGHDPTRRLLFMVTELTFSPPKENIPLETFVRIHHRSGAFGIVSNAKGSNFLTTGIRYRF